MPAALKFSDEQIKNIIYKYEYGKSTIGLGKEYDCDPKVIARILRKNNVNIKAKPFVFNNLDMATPFIDDYVNGFFTQAQLAEKYNLEKECVMNTLRRFEIDIRNHPKIDDSEIRSDFFEVIDSEEKAYILGFLTADGCVTEDSRRVQIISDTIDIHLMEIDRGHLEKFRKILNTKYQVHHNSYNDSCSLRIRNPKMCKDLEKYGIVPRKTGKCFVPIKLIPENLLKHYYRGLVDGDGTVCQDKSGQIFVGLTGDLPIVKGCRDYLGLLLFDCDDKYKIYARKGKTVDFYYTFNISGMENVLDILKHLYKDSTIYLERKFQRYQKYTSEWSLHCDAIEVRSWSKFREEVLANTCN